MQKFVTEKAPGPVASTRGLAMALAVFGGLCAVALAMWGYYGTAVFYEMIIGGLAACF